MQQNAVETTYLGLQLRGNPSILPTTVIEIFFEIDFTRNTGNQHNEHSKLIDHFFICNKNA
jgi:hypothetical protein